MRGPGPRLRGLAGRARSTVDQRRRGQRALRRAHRSSASGHSGAPKLTGGAQNGEGGTGSSIRASPGLERRRGGRATTGKARWCRRSVRGRLELLERENESGESCGEARGGCSPFIGAGGAPGGGGRAVNAGVNGFNAIEGVKCR
jgi:hypothetical protein